MCLCVGHSLSLRLWHVYKYIYIGQQMCPVSFFQEYFSFWTVIQLFEKTEITELDFIKINVSCFVDFYTLLDVKNPLCLCFLPCLFSLSTVTSAVREPPTLPEEIQPLLFPLPMAQRCSIMCRDQKRKKKRSLTISPLVFCVHVTFHKQRRKRDTRGGRQVNEHMMRFNDEA